MQKCAVGRVRHLISYFVYDIMIFKERKQKMAEQALAPHQTNPSIKNGSSAALIIDIDPVMEMYSGGPEGLIQTDSSYILHRKNDPYGNESEALSFVAREPVAGAKLGFSLVQDSESYFFEAPRVDTLNAIRATLPTELGLHTGKFIELNEGVIPAEQIVASIARREIPIAHGKSAGHTEHDITKHMLGYAIMHEGLFSALVELAKRAEASQDKEVIKQVSDTFDFLSSSVTFGTDINTSNVHKLLGASPISAAIRSTRDRRRQQKIIKALRNQ